MRIRKRAALSSSSYPYLTSPTPPPQSLVPDPVLQARPGGGADGAKGEGNNGGGARGGKAAEELHQDGDLKIDPHGLGEDPPRTSLHHPHPSRAGQVQQEMKMEEDEEMVKREEGMMGWISKRWHPQINSNKSGSSSALVQASPLMQKKTNGDKDDVGWSEKGKDRERKAKAASAKARAKTGATSVDGGNNCTGGVNGSDNEGCNTGGATAAALFKDQDKGPSSGGGAAAAAAAAAVNANGPASGKRRRSPAVLMEGSRCSRVNGRGWRCCQQTLVGYSLCEHHLGKGRLRSMSSVRGQIGATTRPKSRNAVGGSTGASGSVAAAALPSPAPQAVHDEWQKKQQHHHHHHHHHNLLGSNNVLNKQDEDELEEEETGRKKVRIKKIGMVKARSISSLLDAVDHVTSSTMAPPEVAPTPRFTAGAGAMA